MNIWFATNNKHKKEELEAILGMKLKIPSEEGLKFNPDEIHLSFHENSMLKAKELQKLLGREGNYIIADDSGLCVDALGGRPGVHSAIYGDTDDKKLNSTQRNNLLLKELGNASLRSARFVCCMVLLLDNDRFYIVQETLEGEIVKNTQEVKGDRGFGYDPVFLLPQSGKTLAELLAEEKNAKSHRGKAGKQIASLLKNL